ncbi:protein of unknown function [Paraburkholderia kururiensis]
MQIDRFCIVLLIALLIARNLLLTTCNSEDRYINCPTAACEAFFLQTPGWAERAFTMF